jgi:hypothetical protein
MASPAKGHVVGKDDSGEEPKGLLALDEGDGLAKPLDIRRAGK